MRKITIIFVILIGFSCNINKNIKTVKYPVGNNQKLILTIPSKYVFTHIGWESTSDIYRYEDSSIIYVSDESNGGINYDNLEASRLRSRHFNAMVEKDSLELGGIDKRGLYWKNYFYHGYDVGYKFVSKARKEEFEKAIKSIKIK